MFFFKQKTAYEMRISDWSSDVCSSDLYLQPNGIVVLEVTAPDKTDRRKRGKNDTIDAENAAHAAFAGIRTVTPKTRDGLVESLRVLKVRSEEHTSELQSLMRISYAVFCL